MEEFRPKTRTELQEYRKLQQKKIGEYYIENYINSHPHMLEITHPITLQINSYKSGYNPYPNIKTRTELNNLRKKQSLIENELTKNFNYKTLSKRVEERERIMENNSENSFPLKIPQDDIKEKTTSGFENKFSKRPIGLHGEELPKFNDHLKDYWKLKEGYTENPCIRLKERPLSRPVSEFTRLKIKSSSVDYQISLKPNENNPFPDFMPLDYDVVEKRLSSRSKNFNEAINFSRPSSQLCSQDLSLTQNIKSRPMTAADSSKNTINHKRARPHTAQSLFKSKNEGNLVRSSGFY